MCNDPDSNGRLIDNIITNTTLPALSRDILKRSLAREEIHEAKVSAVNGAFFYEVTRTLRRTSMANRFEQVDEVVEDAVTIALEQRADGQWAKSLLPTDRPSVAASRSDQRVYPAKGRALRRGGGWPMSSSSRSSSSIRTAFGGKNGVNSTA
jgi:hypothetical protein